jgi:hypothetical protein
MSFDVFVRCYGETEQRGLSRESIRALFPVDEKESDQERWVVRYDPQNWSDIYADPDNEKLTHFMIARPPGELRFWQALSTILQMGQVVIFWPGSPLIVGRSSVDSVPKEMIEALGQPTVVDKAEEFFELLKLT